MADLIHTLKDLNIDNNTLIVFTSDNGPANEAGAGGSYTYNPTFFDSFGPLDGIKRDTWEGGMREPTIVRWPGQIPAGQISHEPSQFHDWMPTLTAAAGVPAPARTDGVSLMPTLTGTTGQRPSSIYVEYQIGSSTPNYTEFEASRRGASRGQEQVIYVDGYKGIRYNVSSGADNFQIYDTLNDPKETTNLAGTNAYFTTLQQRMKDRVLQVRRPGGGVSRPYDSDQVPPVIAATAAGLEYRTFEGTYGYVPDFIPMTSVTNGTCTGVDLSVRTRNEQIGLEYRGYLNVPADGAYTFYLNADSRAFLRLHDASVIDADFGYTGGTEVSATVNLEAGLHPLRLSYARGTGSTPSLSLQWSSTTIAKQAIPATNLLRLSAGGVTPPTATADSASTLMNTTTTISVLLNDALGSGAGPLTVTQVNTPTNGTASINGSNQIVYTPTTNYVGSDSFTYTVSDGQSTAVGTITVSVTAPPPTTVNLWTTTFTGADGTNRNLVNTNGHASFTDTLSADDANLTFQDTTFTGTVFMHSGTMASGTYYSPRTNVDNPSAASPQNGGWWQSEFRYTGGTQSIILSDVVLQMTWSNSGGNTQTGDSTIRDIILTAEYSINDGANWSLISPAQTYNMTISAGNAANQAQNRTYSFASPLAVNHATQDLRLRVRAENTGGTAGGYANIQSMTFVGNVAVPVTDYTTWATLFPSTDLTNPSADADGDGRTNFEEYAFGLNPTDGSSVTPTTVPDKTSGTFTYKRRKQSLTALTYSYKSSTSLATWSAFTPPVPVVSNNGDPVETITVTIPAALLADPSRFFRVEVNSP
jgi:hypothetical protein